MTIDPRLLNAGERVVVSTRTHPKALVGAVLLLLVTVFVTAFAEALVSRELDGTPARVVGGLLALLGVLVVLRWTLLPFLRWWSTTYTFTDRRFMQRTGIIAKEGRTIPLNRISGVDFEIGVVDRLFGCGTLVVSDASEQGRVPLHDIPRVEQVQRLVADELHRLGEDRRDDRGRRDLRDDDGT